MNTLELLFSDIYEFNDKSQENKNNYKRLKNFESYLNNRSKQIVTKRAYKLKFPFNLLCKNKMIVDDLSNPEEIDEYNKEIHEYNNLLDDTKKLNQHLNTLKIEIGVLADYLSFDDYLECCEKYPEMKSKEEYNNIQDKLKGFKEYLHNQVK